jgi:dephospho-CoA kinase
MGKTTAGHMFAGRGIPVIDTDQIAREIVVPGQPALQEIVRAFGSEVLTPDLHLDRKRLAEIVFVDAEARAKLEEILHPRIRSVWRNQVEIWRKTAAAKFGVVVIPLLFETGAERDLDVTACVACSSSTQRARLQQRGWSGNQISARIQAQWPVQKKMDKAHFVLWSEGKLENLDRQVEMLVCE